MPERQSLRAAIMAENPEELHTLGEAAEQVAADAGAPAPAVASKRKRGSALEAARNEVEALVTTRSTTPQPRS